MKLKGLILILAGASQMAIGQNLVENGSFEELTKKPKNPGEVFLAAPWMPGTKATPDLYSKSAKNDLIKVPNNAYGDEEPKDGENYAGILLYSDREKEPRSYLTAKLKYSMLAGEHYCVKFHISFADLSKYATNNIGCYISKDSASSETDLILDYNPQIINSTNRVFEKQWSWEPICRIYIAEGGEQFITIGNFAKQNELITNTVKRPPGYTKSQIRDGYYYIDDISILPNATPENCKCEPGNFAFAEMNKVESEFSTDDKDIPDPVFISTVGEVHGAVMLDDFIHDDVIVQFELGKTNLSPTQTAKLDEVVAFLKEKSDVKIKLVGHNDDSEKVMPKVSENRMIQVSKYLISKGVDKTKIESNDVKGTMPYDNSGTKEGKAKNMIVEVVFYK